MLSMKYQGVRRRMQVPSLICRDLGKDRETRKERREDLGVTK
jgi:hypothetical protein